MAEQIVLSISGMSCNHCKMAVEKALKSLDGVLEASVNLEQKSAKVSFDPAKVSAEDLKAVVSEAGYGVE